MGICSDALYFHLREDMSTVLSSFQMEAAEPWPDITPRQFACQALLKSFYKKYVEVTAEDADDKALEKFKAVNEDCKNWSLRLDSTWDEVLLGELKSSLYNFWYKNGYSLVDNLETVLDRADVGPGASVLASGNDFYTKLFSSRISCTSSSLYNFYSVYVDRQPAWSDAERQRLDHYGSASIVEGSRLSFAPKTVDISRLICVEPSLNMFYQKGLGAILEDRLREVYGISLEDQPSFNRELARLGSIEGNYVTIDLSSASDSLSLRMLDEVLPKPFMALLTKLRSPKVQVGSSFLELNMVSTMGNGFTFPLQTILFSCVVSACMRARGRKLLRNRRSQYLSNAQPGNFGVFGDDIICEQEVHRDVIRLLNILGFKVNTEKTFVEGPFRESCGYDYFSGHNVRGVYCKSLRTQQDLFTLINRLNEWSAQTGVLVPRAVQYLRSRTKYQPVPLHEDLDAGIKLPLRLVTQKRYNRNLLVKYEKSFCRTKGLKIEDGFIRPYARSKPRIYNPSGLLISMLNGCIQRGKIPVRLDVSLYSAKWTVTPNWDYCPAETEAVSRHSLPKASNSLKLEDAAYLNWCA